MGNAAVEFNENARAFRRDSLSFAQLVQTQITSKQVEDSAYPVASSDKGKHNYNLLTDYRISSVRQRRAHPGYCAGSRSEIQPVALCAPRSMLASATTTYPV